MVPERAQMYLQLPLQQWGASNVYRFVLSSWKLNTKHCRKSHGWNGVVDTLGQNVLIFNPKSKNDYPWVFKLKTQVNSAIWHINVTFHLLFANHPQPLPIFGQLRHIWCHFLQPSVWLPLLGFQAGQFLKKIEYKVLVIYFSTFQYETPCRTNLLGNFAKFCGLLTICEPILLSIFIIEFFVWKPSWDIWYHY